MTRVRGKLPQTRGAWEFLKGHLALDRDRLAMEVRLALFYVISRFGLVNRTDLGKYTLEILHNENRRLLFRFLQDLGISKHPTPNKGSSERSSLSFLWVPFVTSSFLA